LVFGLERVAVIWIGALFVLEHRFSVGMLFAFLIYKEQFAQRVSALNAFINDIYGAREVLRAGVVPDDLVFRNPAFRPEMSGQKVPHDIFVHIAGIDIVRVDAETFYVLEDNARTPSGVSYMLENRKS
jgi:uncharacterized circularly permuted ATP-grasp superfamily protein